MIWVLIIDLKGCTNMNNKTQYMPPVAEAFSVRIEQTILSTVKESSGEGMLPRDEGWGE